MSSQRVLNRKLAHHAFRYFLWSFVSFYSMCYKHDQHQSCSPTPCVTNMINTNHAVRLHVLQTWSTPIMQSDSMCYKHDQHQSCSPTPCVTNMINTDHAVRLHVLQTWSTPIMQSDSMCYKHDQHQSCSPTPCATNMINTNHAVRLHVLETWSTPIMESVSMCYKHDQHQSWRPTPCTNPCKLDGGNETYLVINFLSWRHVRVHRITPPPPHTPPLPYINALRLITNFPTPTNPTCVT